MLRLNVAKIKLQYSVQRPIFARKPSSVLKSSCKISPNNVNQTYLIKSSTHNSSLARLYSDKKSGPTITKNDKKPTQNQQDEEINEDNVYVEEDEDAEDLFGELPDLADMNLDEEEKLSLQRQPPQLDDEEKQLLKDLGLKEEDALGHDVPFKEPSNFDEFYKPYETVQDGAPLFDSKDPFQRDPYDRVPPQEQEPVLYRLLERAEERITVGKGDPNFKPSKPNYTPEEINKWDEDAEKPIMDEDVDEEVGEGEEEELPEEKKLFSRLDAKFPDWFEEFEGPPNKKLEEVVHDLLDSLNGDKQQSAFLDSQKVSEELTRLSEEIDTIDGKFEQWKQLRKQFAQFVKKHHSADYFGMPSARTRFIRASGVKPSQANPDLAVSTFLHEQPPVVSAPPPFPGGGTKHLAINRPNQYNPLNLEMVEHLAELFKKYNENETVYSITLKGNGPAFVGGLDLKEMANSDSHIKRQYTFNLYSLMKTLSGIRKFYVPIATGVVAGPGLGMFLHGSVPYVTEQAVLTSTDSAAGLYPLGTFEALNAFFPKWFSKFLLMTSYPITAGHWSMMKGQFIPQSRIPDLERRLSEVYSSKPDRFMQALNEVEEPTFMNPDRIDDAGTWLTTKYDMIGKAFNHTSVAKILEYLDAQNDPFATDLANRMRQRNPLTLLLIQLRFNIETQRQKVHKRRMDEIRAEEEEKRAAAEQVTPENVRNFLATLPIDVFGRGLVAMYDTACKATDQMKPLLQTIVPGRELTDEGVAKLKEGIDNRMKGVAFSVHDFVKAVWDKYSRPFLISPDGATVYPWDPEYPKILYAMKPAEEREKLIKLWQENQAEIVAKLKDPKNRDPNENIFSEESEAMSGIQGIILPEGGAFNWFAEEAVRQHNEVIMQSVPEHFWDHMCQKVYYAKPGESVDPMKLRDQGGIMPGAEAPEAEQAQEAKSQEITVEEKIAAELTRLEKELLTIRQMEARAFYRLAQSPEFPATVKSLLQKGPAPTFKPVQEFDFKTVLSYFMPGQDTMELDAAISLLDSEPLPDKQEWERPKKYRPYWNHAYTVEMDAEEAL